MFVKLERFDMKDEFVPIAIDKIAYLESKGGELTETKRETDRIPNYVGVYITGCGRLHCLPVVGTVESVLAEIDKASGAKLCTCPPKKSADDDSE